MKNILLPISILCVSVTSTAQIFNTGFENNNGTPLSEFTILNLDQETVPSWAPVQELNENGWIQFYDGYDNKIVFSTSLYENADAASNDWLITPAISLPDTGSPTLYWDAKSYGYDALDDYSIKVSTTDNDPGSFQEILYVEDEQPFDFNARTLDLSAYKGQQIYLAIVNVSNNGYYLALDNLYISNSTNCYAPSASTFEVTDLSKNEFTANWGALSGNVAYGVGVTTFNNPVSKNGETTNTSFHVEVLDTGTRYQYFVKNENCGSGWAGPKSVFTPTLLPYSYGFEFTEENYGEYDSDGWSSMTWLNGNNTGLAYEGETYAYTNGSTSETTDKWLYSYPIWLEEDQGLKIEFASVMQTGADNGTLSLSVDRDNEANGDKNIIQTYSVSAGEYQLLEGDFKAPETGIYYVGFGNNSLPQDSYYAMRIDDIKFTEVNLSLIESATNTIDIYPNPVANTLHFTTMVKDVQIINTVGMIIINTDNCTTLELSHLPKGVYFVTYKLNGTSYKKKIIKN